LYLGTFESPKIMGIHYAIFNVKNLNLIEVSSFKVFNNVLGRKARDSSCQKLIFG
jgi:hypothetical protein